MIRLSARWRHIREVILRQRRLKMTRPTLNILRPPAPSDNPNTEEEGTQMTSYKQWLVNQESAINEQLDYNETEITKLMKRRKAIRQRTLRQNNSQLSAQDAAELKRVSLKATGLRKSLQNLRRRSRQHNMLMTDALAPCVTSSRSRNLWPGQRTEPSGSPDLSPPPVTRLLEIEDY